MVPTYIRIEWLDYYLTTPSRKLMVRMLCMAPSSMQLQSDVFKPSTIHKFKATSVRSKLSSLCNNLTGQIKGVIDKCLSLLLVL